MQAKSLNLPKRNAGKHIKTGLSAGGFGGIQSKRLSAFGQDMKRYSKKEPDSTV